jgi:hypothetical protein
LIEVVVVEAEGERASTVMGSIPDATSIIADIF